jgi:hypothetical protein
MKKGGGIGPTKPWQPLRQIHLLEKVPNPICESGKDKLCDVPSLFFATKYIHESHRGNTPGTNSST